MTEEITLAEGQTWEWATEEGEILLHDASVTIEALFESDEGTPMVTFTEPADGLYTETTTTVEQAALKRSLAEEYELRTDATA